MKKLLLPALAFAVLFTASCKKADQSAAAQGAQTTAPAKTEATKTEAKAPAEKKAEKPRTAASLECSKEAEAKGLHGKERRKFRRECKKAAAEKAK